MFVLYVSRQAKVFVAREVTSDAVYDAPSYSDVSLVDDSIQGRLDVCAEIVRIAKEEGWRKYDVCFE